MPIGEAEIAKCNDEQPSKAASDERQKFAAMQKSWRIAEGAG
jgi:hypothetical protein